MIGLSQISHLSPWIRSCTLRTAFTFVTATSKLTACSINNNRYYASNASGNSFKDLSSKQSLTMPSYDGIEIPEERQKLKFLEKVPQIASLMKVPKLTKKLDLIRGEEEIHTDFIHQQYGIVALRGGFLRHGHMEMIRRGIHYRLNTKTSFAIWRVEAPWKPMFKKGIGKRMGGGKGNISYYATPVKAKRVIIEVAGKCSFEEVKRMLEIIAHKLPFPAAVMTQEMINEERETEARLERENTNPFTFKYVLQNNMMGCQMWAKKYIDNKYFGKYD